MNVLAPIEMQEQPLQKKSVEKQEFQYVNKFKSAIYTFVLFIILSHKVAYKVLDLIIKVFTHNIEVIDENDNPMILGTLIMAVLFALIIFLF